MNAATLKAAARAAVEQGFFDFLCPWRKPLVTPGQAAESLGRGVHHVYNLIEEGKLEAHRDPSRDVKRAMITKRSVLLRLAETATYQPADIIDRMADVAVTLTPAQWAQFLSQANAKRARL